MGLDITIRTKHEQYDCSESLSRRFCYLLNGRVAIGEDYELRQLENLFEIDLSVFLRKPINLEPNNFKEYMEFLNAQDAGDQEKMKLLKKEVERIEKEWKENYDKINEGWTKIQELREVVQKLKNKIEQNPDYHKKLRYNLPWAEYFSKIKSERETLMKDLLEILAFLDCAEKHGHEYVAFVFG